MKKYSIVYADPPWQFKNANAGGKGKSGASSVYNTMSLGELCQLPINEMTADNSVLVMWWIGSLPMEALKVVNDWGFKIKTMTGFTWVKKTKNGKHFFGMGYQTRQGAEHALIAVKGKYKRVNAGIRSVHEAVYEGHSCKPDLFRKLIVDLYGDVPRLELFARENKEGWDAFGNEVEESITITY
jgi:N6-adenosine-specific RNA methylase IME4